MLTHNFAGMEAIQNIIVDNTLENVKDDKFASYLCHAYCHSGSCTFEHNGRKHTFEKGNCLIISGRNDLIENISQSSDFTVDVIYVSQEFIAISTPQSNYGMRGHLALFNNPVMQLTPNMQQTCKRNFELIHSRLSQPQHHFYRDALMNAVQMMIIDFFDFHAELYGEDKITTQYYQLMEQFLNMLEQGEYERNRNIGYYADKLCVTSKYLSEVSKKVSGLPANYWITRYTSLEISRLLRDKNLSFTDISDRFGFSSLSHFSRYVQNNLGATPTDFRE